MRGGGLVTVSRLPLNASIGLLEIRDSIQIVGRWRCDATATPAERHGDDVTAADALGFFKAKYSCG